MDNVKKLLDAVKQRNGITSDYALAKILTLPSPRICDYYKGNRAPDEFACLQIANALDMSLEQVIAAVKVDTEKDETRRTAWEKYYKRVGGIAAALFLAVLLNVTFKVTSIEAQASDTLKAEASEFVLCKVVKKRVYTFS